MPNHAATDTGGAVGHRTRTLGLALLFPVIARRITHVGVHPGADLRVIEEGSVLSFAPPITSHRVLHGLS
ncbi:phosphate transporter [Burkholderia cenocepacia]|uniref:phosphate transporter n=1 Tax=Burkholderia cenocepacia TaxID=95486 RepID=UPI00158A8CDD|nr:phosphate transporter [Burkholderia cenocepacia]